jgi:hypothetical protein
MSRKRPQEPPLLEEAVFEALAEANGNVAAAADALGVRSDRLRAYVHAKPRLKSLLSEVLERGVDRSIEVLFEGLANPAWTLRLAAAKEFMRSEAAARRGFRTPLGQSVEVKSQSGGTLMLKWLDDEPIAAKQIEGKAA